ncbi:hypothetical protein JTB14_031333 [Gonioctena quinquepunctata]|nr:hypothetical protein JTB14_031333 [Gonioctena quinquepunctata]
MEALREEILISKRELQQSIQASEVNIKLKIETMLNEKIRTLEKENKELKERVERLERGEEHPPIQVEGALTALSLEQIFEEYKDVASRCRKSMATIAIDNEAYDNQRASMSDTELESMNKLLQDILKSVSMFWQSFLRNKEGKHTNVCVR